MTSAKSAHVRLRHILENIDGILSATKDVKPDAIADDFLVLRAIERCIQIISEAAKELPSEMRASEPDIPGVPLLASAIC